MLTVKLHQERNDILMKRLLYLILTVCICVSLVACGGAPKKSEEKNTELPKEEIAEEDTNKNNEEPITITVGVPTAPPALPVLRMIETKALGDDVEIKLSVWNEPETLIAMVQDSEHDMFAFPLTVVSKLYNKGMDVRLMNVNTWGVTYFMTSDPDFDSWDDLKGKTIYVPLQSSPPDALTQYFLEEAGLEVGKDVEIVYATTVEVATMLASGDAVYGTLIEPQVTKALMDNQNLRVVFNFEDEWQRVTETDTKIPNAGFGTTQTFIDENPEWVSAFQDEYEKATIWANENPEEIGILAEKYLGLKAPLIVESIPNMGLEFKSAINSQDELKMFYELINDFNPDMIGGKVADTKLYYEK